MTAEDWTDATELSLGVREFVLPRLSDRKRRLFACACLRRVWHILNPDVLRDGVELAEQVADGVRPARGAASVRRGVRELAQANDVGSFHALAVRWAIERHRRYPLCTVQYASEALAHAEGHGQWSDSYRWVVRIEKAEQMRLLRCLFGNPFRPVAVESDWRTPTVVDLATGIYTDRAWDRLPILADALDDAGCTDPDVIGHLRGRGPHARGCWVVDLILGKS